MARPAPLSKNERWPAGLDFKSAYRVSEGNGFSERKMVDSNTWNGSASGVYNDSTNLNWCRQLELSRLILRPPQASQSNPGKCQNISLDSHAP
jgi:hypothetical protein